MKSANLMGVQHAFPIRNINRKKGYLRTINLEVIRIFLQFLLACTLPVVFISFLLNHNLRPFLFYGGTYYYNQEMIWVHNFPQTFFNIFVSFMHIQVLVLWLLLLNAHKSREKSNVVHPTFTRSTKNSVYWMIHVFCLYD